MVSSNFIETRIPLLTETRTYLFVETRIHLFVETRIPTPRSGEESSSPIANAAGRCYLKHNFTV
jgi:hypothetical protein